MIRIWSCSNSKCIRTNTSSTLPRPHLATFDNFTLCPSDSIHVFAAPCVLLLEHTISPQLMPSLRLPSPLKSHVTMWIVVFLKLLSVFQVIWAQLKSFKTLFVCTLWSSDFQRVKLSHGDLNSVSALYHIRFSVQYIAFFVSHVSNDSSKSCAKAEAVAAMAKELHQLWGTLEIEIHSFHRALCNRKPTRHNKIVFDINGLKCRGSMLKNCCNDVVQILGKMHQCKFNSSLSLLNHCS